MSGNNTKSTSLQPSSSSDIPLIAEPPSPFNFTPNLTSHSRRSSVDITTTPEQSFVNILSPTLEPMQTESILQRSSNTSLSSLQQTGRGDAQAETNTLQGLITSHGIGAYSMPTSQGGLIQRRLHQGMSNNSTTAASSAVQIQEIHSTTSMGFTRNQDHSLPLNFVQSHGHPANIGTFTLPPLTLPPHLQTEHSLAFDSAPHSMNGLLGESSNQLRNLHVLNASQKNSVSSSHSEPRTSNHPGVVPPMPVSLAHMAASGNLPGGIPNPSSLPLFPGMPSMYPYPYPTSLPSLPSHIPSSNMPPFPPQGLVSRYPAPYVTPPLYGNSQPPIMNRRWERWWCFNFFCIFPNLNSLFSYTITSSHAQTIELYNVAKCWSFALSCSKTFWFQKIVGNNSVK